jgi:phosphomannomutase
VIDAGLAAAAQRWIEADPHDGDRAELTALVRAATTDVSAAHDLAARFVGPLTFGTAGLRGPLRAGPNGMNLAVVRRTTAGVATWLRAAARDGVVIGFDARHRSREFAEEAAGVLAAGGLRVCLADRSWPTPLTAFAVRHLDAGAGIQITASHNPASDNGYKVYDHTGTQIIPPDDARIAAEIEAQPAARDIEVMPVTATVGDAIVERYLDLAATVGSATTRRDVRIVYTPLCGVGGEVMTRLFARVGFDDVHVVDSQASPDPMFPGLPFPNPEEPGVLDAAIELGVEVDADLVIANDPDADRLAVCVPHPSGQWRMLSGDELGLVLGEALMRATRGIVARTAVSSPALDAVAARFGSESVVTPTGFKWLSRAADGRDTPLVFAYEEALGYLVNPRVRDKDGMTAAIVAAACAAEEPLLARLARIASIDGAWVTAQWAPRFEGADGLRRMRDVVNSLGDGDPVVVELEAGHALVRPSGTEPKLKCYFRTRVDLDDDDVATYERARETGLQRCEAMRIQLAPRLGLDG